MHAKTVTDQCPLLNGVGICLENSKIQPRRSEGFKVFRTGEKGENLRQWTGDLLRKAQGIDFIRHPTAFLPLEHTRRVPAERHLSHCEQRPQWLPQMER